MHHGFERTAGGTDAVAVGRRGLPARPSLSRR